MSVSQQINNPFPESASPAFPIFYEEMLLTNEEIVARVRANPKYEQLKKTRSGYGWIMTLLIMLAYYGYILLIAFDPKFLAQKIGEGWTTSIGVPMGVGVILFTIALTWIYVARANSQFDDMKEELISEASKK